MGKPSACLEFLMVSLASFFLLAIISYLIMGVKLKKAKHFKLTNVFANDLTIFFLVKFHHRHICIVVLLWNVYTGHGGSRAAEYLKEHLFDNLMKHPLFITNTNKAICACLPCYTINWVMHI